MTELIPAEEWAKIFSATRWIAGCRIDPGYVALEEFRDIQRNAAQHYLEAAAKAVCWACREGIPLDARQKYGCQHVQDARGDRYRCTAQPIWQLIPKDPAPADEEHTDGDT